MLLAKIINFVSKSSQQIIKRIFSRDNLLTDDSNENFFKALTPTIDSDQDGVYEKALLHALKNAEIKNIAVTGGYGAGKSSVIKTFFHKHNGLHPVEISLATFGQDKSIKYSWLALLI